MTIERHGERHGPDGGTVVESLEAFRQQHAADAPRRTLMEPVSAPPGGPGNATQPPVLAAPGAEPAFRPTLRPPVPRLTILDDGEPVAGQTLRLRDDVVVIGRTEGDVRLPHDMLVSTRHAEIVRRGRTGSWRWLLRDLGSTNGTFVACTRAPLRTDRLVMLGGRRYRFRPPAEASAAIAAHGTLMIPVAAGAADGWPSLVEVGRPAAVGVAEIPLPGPSVVVGRRGGTNDVPLDDPLVAPQAARIVREPAGSWVIEALPSRNGLWMQVMEVELSAMCRFQIGEQRFLFVV